MPPMLKRIRKFQYIPQSFNHTCIIHVKLVHISLACWLTGVRIIQTWTANAKNHPNSPQHVASVRRHPSRLGSRNSPEKWYSSSNIMSCVEHTCETAYIIYIYYMYIHQYNEHVNILYIDPMIQPPTIQIHIRFGKQWKTKLCSFRCIVPRCCWKVKINSRDSYVQSMNCWLVCSSLWKYLKTMSLG